MAAFSPSRSLEAKFCQDMGRLDWGAEQERSSLVKMAQETRDFRRSCQNFVYDLRMFNSSKGAESRLGATGHEFFIGPPYFSPAVREQILQLPVCWTGLALPVGEKADLSCVLRRLAIKRSDSSICASHDLAPIFEHILGVQ